VRLRIEHSLELGERLSVGASLAVSGVCLTVLAEERTARLSAVELSPETLARTTLGGLRGGDPVNLEPSLRAGDPLGGHWVQGHVDTTVEVLERRQRGDHRELAFAMPGELAAYLVEKGSVALDGVSLTISALAGDRFEVALIPHTLEVTTLSRLAVGHRVNLEVDILAKYIARALEARGLLGAAAPE
jgi:riboflavin synthase